MSKIYEALLQAEQDRAKTAAATQPETVPASETTPPVPVEATPEAIAAPPQPAPVAAASVAAAPVVAAPLAAAAPVAEQAPEAAAETMLLTPPVVARAAVALEPAQATYRVWHPDLPKLPAVQPRGSQVEQFRSLRSKLFEFRDLNTLKTLLVSSGRPAEGKSFVAMNLAITFARHKSARVLVIDGDMRRSTLQHLLGAPNELGLADYLAGKASLNEIMQRGKMEEGAGPMPPGLGFLTFIPAGDGGDKAADLSGSARFKALIDELAPHFDWIVVDSSPVNLVTDAVNLARSCDGVLLIARGGVTKFETAQRAITELKASKILGLVLNAVEDAPAADGYYGYDTYDSVKE